MSTSLAGLPPAVTVEVVRDYAADAGVCIRPLLRQVTDRETGQSTSVVIRCGSTREAVCPPCAERARRLRMQQCAEGWHLVDDPLPPTPQGATRDTDDEGDDQDADADLGASMLETHRRVRSTRRRADVVDLPKVPQEHRTVGRTFTAPDGTIYRPSMFVTLTLGSYGKVIPGRKGVYVPGAGTPVDPGTYDYRRAPGGGGSSRGCSTGGGRTCAAGGVTRCSTSAPSSRSPVWPPTSPPPSGGPSPAGSSEP